MVYEIAFPAAVINKTELSTDRRYLPRFLFYFLLTGAALFFCVIPGGAARCVLAEVRGNARAYVCTRACTYVNEFFREHIRVCIDGKERGKEGGR